MKINWKLVSQSPGYISLKNVYIKAVQGAETHRAKYKSKPMREKQEFLDLFNWIICRAKHYSNHTGKPIEIILLEWEQGRTYWWLNYYQEGNQPKFTSKSLKPQGVNGHRKYTKTWGYRSKQAIKNSVCSFIKHKQEKASKKKKIRWDNTRKRKAKEYRIYIAKNK